MPLTPSGGVQTTSIDACERCVTVSSQCTPLIGTILSAFQRHVCITARVVVQWVLSQSLSIRWHGRFSGERPGA